MIGIKLKNFQENAIDFLFDKTTDSNSKPKIVMQSPTGSGKTIIFVRVKDNLKNNLKKKWNVLLQL